MKKIEKYVARDGTEFHSEDDALHRERVLDDVARIESILPKRPQDSGFANGHGYIQHNPERVEHARAMLYELACEEIPILADYDLRSYGFTRYLSDNSSTLWNLYHRLVICMDDGMCREYGQGYFTAHRSEVEDVCLNA